MLKQIADLWRNFSSKRKAQFFLLIILMIFASLLEVLTIGAVVPFLTVISDPESLKQHNYFDLLDKLLSTSSTDELVLPLTIIFVASVLFAGFIRVALVYASTRYSYALGADLSQEVFKKTLYQDYVVHLSRNSSEVINSATNKVNIVVSGILTPLITLTSSAFIVIFIVLALVLIEPLLTLYIFSTFTLIYITIIFSSRKILAINSRCYAQESTKLVKIIQEGLGGIRDVIIDNNQEYYSRIFKKSDIPMRKALGTNVIINSSPRFIIESLGVAFITLLAFYLVNKEEGFVTVIPMLGVIAIAAQRILPALQQLYGAIVSIKGNLVSLEDVLVFLEFKIPKKIVNKQEITFKDKIALRNVSFSYLDNINVVDDINLEIPVGSKIGFIGETGSGKSTFLDMIMGLLTPKSGSFIVDNIEIDESNRHLWRKKIAHVPQSIFLSDSSIIENIAFGVSKEFVDDDHLKKVINMVKLDDFVNSLPENLNSQLGERGAKLSGGQRQRIGIARALYKNPSILILDEATSALDENTEKYVISQIEEFSKDITLLVISHRISTLKNCDFIYELKNKNIKKVNLF